MFYYQLGSFGGILFLQNDFWQSFQAKGFWMAKGPGCLTDGEMAYDNSSRIEPKRAHQWFVDSTEPELFPNKKQAIEASNSKSISGIANVNASPWENVSSVHSLSGQFSDQLFGSETARTINFSGRDIPSVNAGNSDMGRKSIEEQFGNDPSVGLSISHTMEEGSCLSYGGRRKVKINQVRGSDNGISGSMGDTYNGDDNTTISMNHTYNKGDDNTISMGHTYNRGNDSAISMGLTYNKEDDNNISMGHTYNNGAENTISMGLTYNKGEDNTISMGHIFNKGDGNIISMGHSCKRETNTISFGGFHEEPETNPSGRLISSYDLLMSQSSEALGGKELGALDGELLLNTAPLATSGTEIIPKSKMELKMSKKAAPSNFPSNVRSLLSTAMLDGVPVKYISWSREVNFRSKCSLFTSIFLLSDFFGYFICISEGAWRNYKRVWIFMQLSIM